MSQQKGKSSKYEYNNYKGINLFSGSKKVSVSLDFKRDGNKGGKRY